jgi:uncharacterized protein (DUF608 family)
LFTYDSAHQSEISFPLGGIGSGCIGLAGNGRLMDWEIYGRPNKGSENGYTHFAVKCAREGETLDAKVLQSDLTGSLQGSFSRSWGGAFGWGPAQESMAGFPHFREAAFEGVYPFAKLQFRDETFPGKASLRAFNPFIPLDDKNSSLPAAFFTVAVENTNAFAADYSVAFALRNPHNSIAAVEQNGLRGFYFDSAQDSDSAKYGNMAVLTDAADIDLQEQWYRGEWFDAQTVYWNQFTREKRLPARRYADGGRNGDHAVIAAHAHLQPGESRSFRFVLSWSSPNFENYWDRPKDGEPFRWKNYYASLFGTALESARYCMENWDSLQRRTESFRDALLRSSLPSAALEAVVSNLALLKSPTVLRLEDGALYGFEGVGRNSGVCDGSCTHVWNYAYAFPFLFPALERSMRSLDYKYNLRPDGSMPYRLKLPPGRERSSGSPCADGQLGGVLKTYRDWKISGDDDWLRSLWPGVKKSVEFAWSAENADFWDRDRDGVLEGRQHHTLDMELFGPNSWLTGFYLAALKAGAEMAAHLGEQDVAADWLALFAQGKAFCDEKLFNGAYYHQLVDLKNKEQLARYNGEQHHECNSGDIYKSYWNDEAGELKYQVAQGCEIQQVVAQWHANLCGLGEIFEQQQVRTALASLYKNNFVPEMRRIANFCRNYSLNGEGGLLIATWPEGTYRPVVPLPYETETMNGFEYQALIHMIQEGMVEEGLAGVAAIRERYDGQKRNPWNEFECGGNYARSMASYALLPAFSGFQFDMVQGHMGFAPVETGGAPEQKRFFWSLDCAWGEVALEGGQAELSVAEGTLTLRSFALPGGKTVQFDPPLVLRANERKTIA